MEDLSNRFKGVFVQTFRNSGTPYGNMTVKELVDIFQKQLDEKDRLQRETEDAVIEKYTGVYLKTIDDEGIFGETLVVIKIDSLSKSSYIEDFDRTYLLKGTRINFSDTNLYVRDFDTSAQSMYTQKELDTYTEISEEEYNSYYNQFIEIHNKLRQIVNG